MADCARRRRLLGAVPVLLVAGLAARFGLPGALGDATGGIAYAAFAYLLIALVLPREPPARVAAAALAFSVAIELFQLTPVPRSMADAFGPSRLVFGTGFAATDLLVYAAGALLAALVDGRVPPDPPPRD